jgi:tRNA/tmRNA/rRNA uracil-C5-methylase (TrmA/RlmC/RlmD family)
VETVLQMLAPAPGERALDLFAGVGLFSAFLAEAVGSSGTVTAVEGDRRATELARENLAGHDQVTVVRDRVDRALRRGGAAGGRSRGITGADVVVLDPPRAGARRQVVRDVAALAPRAVAYVACDPAALARDVGYFAEAGYRLADLRAFDLFPMTHHVECVALVVPR